MQPRTIGLTAGYWVCGMAAVLLATPPAKAIVSTSAPSNWVGTAMSALDAEAELLINFADGTAGLCSGSLLAGGQYILTAGHCVTGAQATTPMTHATISLMNGTITGTASRYDVNPGWDGNPWTGNDIGLIKLDTPITGVTGYAPAATSSADGDTVLLAGYGNTGTGTSGYVSGTYGTLHYGYNQYDYPVTYPVYLYDFDDGTTGHNIFGSTGLGSNEATIAPADSGGGSLVQIDNTWEIVGVHSFTACYSPCSFTSSYGQWGGDMPVYSNLAWLDSILPGSSPVPEPATTSLLGVALFGLGLVRRQI